MAEDRPGLRLATLIYVRSEGRTLMVHRNRKPGDWHEGRHNGLGGKLEPGESPEQCMQRELLEESGLTALTWRLNGMITFPTFDRSNDWYVFVYTVSSYSGNLMTDSPEGDLLWVPDGELQDLNLWPGDRIFLPWLDRDGFFSARFMYDGPELIDHTAVWY